MLMIDFPNWFAGTITIVALVGLGIFVYPWLLARKGGIGAVGAITVLLAFLFYAFDSANNVPIATSATLAILWAVAPVAVGFVVRRLQGSPSAG
jgi:hypothetical protein